MENKEYGGFWIRFLANLIDGIVLAVPMFLLNMIVYQQVLGMSEWEHQSLMMDKYSNDNFYIYETPWEVTVWVLPISFAMGVLYSSLLTASKWQGTVGKRALGLKVVDMEGNRIGIGRSIGRYFAYFPSGLIFYIGYIMVGLTDKKQGLHDMMAKTYVLKTK